MGQQRTSLTEGGSQKTPLCLCWAHDRNTAAEATVCKMPGVCLCMGVGDMGHRDTDAVIANCLSMVTQTSNHGLGMLRLP